MKSWFKSAALAVALAAASAGCATAPPPDPAAVAGAYTFLASGQHAAFCRIELLADTPVPDAPHFHNAVIGEECEYAFGFLPALIGWETRPGGVIRLIGAEGSTMGDFRPDEYGIYRGRVENDGQRYSLAREVVTE